MLPLHRKTVLLGRVLYINTKYHRPHEKQQGREEKRRAPAEKRDSKTCHRIDDDTAQKSESVKQTHEQPPAFLRDPAEEHAAARRPPHRQGHRIDRPEDSKRFHPGGETEADIGCRRADGSKKHEQFRTVPVAQVAGEKLSQTEAQCKDGKQDPEGGVGQIKALLYPVGSHAQIVVACKIKCI